MNVRTAEYSVGKLITKTVVACLPLLLIAATMIPDGGGYTSQPNNACAPINFTGPSITMNGGRRLDTPRFKNVCVPLGIE